MAVLSAERWQQVAPHLDRALQLRGAERVTLLASVRAQDPQLGADLESLLAEHRALSEAGFLAGGHAAALELRDLMYARPEARGGSRADARIGPYRVVREIGRGGMGAVYLAERDDQAYRKQVAIKLIRNDLGSSFVVQRFRQERQILAGLDHPNIARLFDGGTTDDGLSYFVMEWVEGQPLDAYCEARHLTIDQRLGLFRTICSAVAYAHQKMVIHRDLKPDNILVTADGTPKLLDFGIAKLLLPQAESDRTATGTRLMTPEYASPEQWRRGSISEASDVYSLGVILHRLLTGRTPYRVDSELPHELGRAICEQDPEPPSSAAPAQRQRLAGDLDAIVLKALRKEPERRYRSVEALSEDLRRHLEGLPITARPNSLLYRAGRLVRRNRVAAVAAVAVAAAAALVFALAYRLTTRGGPPPAPSALTSLAVLPLKNLSRDPEQEFFADGMTEALITNLSRIRSLRVISRTSAMRYKETKKSLPEIARELKVEGIVEGSVVRSGGRVRITAHLIRASDDRQIWAESYERELRDILALQGAVAQDIAGQIRGQLTPREQEALTNRPLTKPAAYLAYVRGRYFWNQRTEESLKAAISYFEEALREDPTYAPAYTGLADSYFWRGHYFGRLPPKEAMTKARAAALKALALDDNLAEAHTSLARVYTSYDWDFVAAEREIRRAIELNPNYPSAHHTYSFLLSVLLRMDESVAEARRALALDPLSLPLNNHLGNMLNLAGRYDEAIALLGKTLELDPSYAAAHETRAEAYLAKGQHARAIEGLLRAKALDGVGPEVIQGLRQAFERGGLRAYQERELELALAGWDGWHVNAMTIAAFHARLGHRDEAMAWLEKAYQARSTILVALFGIYRQDMKSLRSDPRFTDLVRRIGLPTPP